ncbi:MAG: hypothetical protein HYU36_15835 [Planctomycetes bacterium]|nr:hypothetical protein [Planctomycetota bacterium]
MTKLLQFRGGPLKRKRLASGRRKPEIVGEYFPIVNSFPRSEMLPCLRDTVLDRIFRLASLFKIAGALLNRDASGMKNGAEDPLQAIEDER